MIMSAERKARSQVRSRPSGRRPEDRRHPDLYACLLADPTLPLCRDSLEAQVDALKRPSRRYLYPIIRLFVRVAIPLVLFMKRLLPFPVGSERALGRLTVTFVSHWVSPEAQLFLLRHFTVETNLINFVARNCGSSEVLEVDLKPTRIEQLDAWESQNTIVRHDANLFNLILDLGYAADANVDRRLPLREIDFSCLEVPDFEIEWDRKRLANFDVQTTLCVTAFFLAVFLTEDVAERAVNSLQFDESLLACLANLTGDPVFRTWAPHKFPTWLGSPDQDAARDLHWHMLVNEYAHTRLCEWAPSATDRT